MAIKFGAAGSDTDKFKGALTALAGNEARAQQALDLADALSPKLQEFDPYIAAMKYFTGMTAAASQPGATVFGSAAQAFASPVAYLQEVNDFNRKIETSKPQTAVSIAQSLKPPAGKVTYRPASEEELKKYGATVGQVDSNGRFYDLSKTSSTSVTKPFDVKITNPTAFNKEFGSVNLPEDGIIPMTSAQLSLLPMGSYEFPEPPDSNATKPFSIEILDDAAFKLKFPDTTIPADKIISIDSQDADSLPIGSYKLYDKPKTFAEKYLQQQPVVYAKDETEAKKILSDLGVEEDNTEYASLLATITTDDEELFGKPIIIADQYVSFYKPVNSELFNVIIRAPSGGAVPPEVTSRNAEIKALVPMQLAQQSIARELIPTLEGALTILMQNPDMTGAFQSATMEARNFLSSAFGFSDAELESQKFLTALSNKLAPKMRPVGSGSTSDMEFKSYKQAILDMNNPAKTNYLTMYSLKKSTEAAVEELSLRKKLLNAGKSETYIANKILERPATIYEKFNTINENGDDLYQDGDEAQFIIDRDIWFNSLPNGAVILNKDSRLGNKIFPGASATLIIKGWRGDQ